MTLAPIDQLAFRVSDQSDHISGGHCVALPGTTSNEERVALVDQYFNALRLLVEDAERSGDMNALSRPILFTTHHLCELAIKAALLSRSASTLRSHYLPELWATAVTAGCFQSMTKDEREWCAQFATNLGEISGDGTPGRFVDGVVGGSSVDAEWCCLDISAIYNAAMQFASLCIAEVTGGGTTT